MEKSLTNAIPLTMKRLVQWLIPIYGVRYGVKVCLPSAVFDECLEKILWKLYKHQTHKDTLVSITVNCVYW